MVKSKLTDTNKEADKKHENKKQEIKFKKTQDKLNRHRYTRQIHTSARLTLLTKLIILNNPNNNHNNNHLPNMNNNRIIQKTSFVLLLPCSHVSACVHLCVCVPKCGHVGVGVELTLL